MSTLSNLSNPFPGPHPHYDYDLSTELSPALYLSSPIGPLHSISDRPGRWLTFDIGVAGRSASGLPIGALSNLHATCTAPGWTV